MFDEINDCCTSVTLCYGTASLVTNIVSSFGLFASGAILSTQIENKMASAEAEYVSSLSGDASQLMGLSICMMVASLPGICCSSVFLGGCIFAQLSKLSNYIVNQIRESYNTTYVNVPALPLNTP